MGYTTDFRGEFSITPKLSKNAIEFLTDFSMTRRMGRTGLPEEYGVEGEFYCVNDGNFGQTLTGEGGHVENYNRPPSTQPGLWCQWTPDEEGEFLVWDQGEKFYNYIEWLRYLIDKVFHPNGYVLNGEVQWRGEEWEDNGTIVLENNVLYIDYGVGMEEFSRPQDLDVVWIDKSLKRNK